MYLPAKRLNLSLLLLVATWISGCSSTPRLQTAVPFAAPTGDDYCIGRLAVFAKEPLHFLDAASQFYWGDIDTYREDAAAYRQRLLAAQAPASDEGVRQLLVPVEQLTQDNGLLIISHEEAALPFDLNVVQVTGFAHRDGTTFRYKKRAVRHLQAVAALRTREILASVTSSAQPFPPSHQGHNGFCVMYGGIKLIPLPGWHEASRAEGEFMLQGAPYRFSLRTRHLRSLSLNDPEILNQRTLLVEVAGGVEDTALVAASEPMRRPTSLAAGELNGVTSLLDMTTQTGSKRVYEWHSPASSTAPGTPAIFLYIWPAASEPTAQEDAIFLHWLASRPQLATPLLQLRPMTLASNAMPAQPAKEESKVVYRMQLNYYDDETAADRHYIIYKDGQKVDDGRSDVQGFTSAHNADYDERWEIKVMSD